MAPIFTVQHDGMRLVLDQVKTQPATREAWGHLPHPVKLELLMRGRRANGSGFAHFDAAGKGGTALSIRRSASAS